MTEREIEIVIKATLQNEKAFKTTDARLNDLQDTSEKTTDRMDELSESTNKFQKILDNPRSIRVFTQYLTRMFGQVNPLIGALGRMVSMIGGPMVMGVVAATTVATAAFMGWNKMVSSTEAAVGKLRDRAIDLGMSMEQLAKRQYGTGFDSGLIGIFGKEEDINSRIKQLKEGEKLVARMSFIQSAKNIGGKMLSGAQSLMSNLGILSPALPMLSSASKAMQAGSAAQRAKATEVWLPKELELEKKLSLDIIALDQNTFNQREALLEKEYEKNKEIAGDKKELIEANNKWYEEAERQLGVQRTRTVEKVNATIMDLEGNRRAAFLENIRIENDVLIEQGQLTAEQAEKLTDLKLGAWERARWGIETLDDTIVNLQRQSLASVEDMFTNVFVDGLNNKFATARDIVASFFLDLQRMAVKAMMSYAVNQIFGAVLGGIGGGGGTGTIIGGVGGAVTNTAQFGNVWSPFGRAGGGGIPDDGLYQLHRGEQVTKASDVESDPRTVTYIIHAVDARSFAQIVASNPSAIEAVVNQSLRYNKGTRSTIKQLAR